MCFNFTQLKIEYQQKGQPAQVNSWDFVAHAPIPIGGP